ncbi:hypothetical protein ACFL1H_06730, partial [Nanoarchaeota archaeon]
MDKMTVEYVSHTKGHLKFRDFKGILLNYPNYVWKEANSLDEAIYSHLLNNNCFALYEMRTYFDAEHEDILNSLDKLVKDDHVIVYNEKNKRMSN